MQGEIDVEWFMEFSKRRRGMVEWIALKEYWRASEQDKPTVLFLYGKILEDALEKYRQRYNRDKLLY